MNCALRSSVNTNWFYAIFHKMLHITDHCFMFLLTSIHAIVQCDKLHACEYDDYVKEGHEKCRETWKIPDQI